MGAYLDKPITEKESESGQGNGLTYGATCMQGWRVKQEDAHNCILDLNAEWSMFAVYDGHGGDEVSRYTAMKLPEFLKEREFWANDDLVTTLQQIFIDFDDVLRSEEVMKELKKMAKESEDAPDRDDDGDNSEDESDRIQTIEESSMPLEEILTRFYRQGYIIGRNPVKNKVSLEELNAEQESGDDKCSKGKRQSRSPTQEPAKRAKTEGNGSLLSMLITDGENGDGDKANTELNANESKVSENPVEKSSNDSSDGCNSNNVSSKAEADAEEKKEDEIETTTPVIKTKQKKTPVNAEKKVDAADDGIMDDEDSEDDSDFNEAEEEAEDEECEDEEECESDDDGEDVAIPGGLETPGEDSGTTACVCLMSKDRIIVANSGDSRAVLCRDGTAIDLSLDHKPEDDVERTRIVNAGGFVNEDGRVNGGLNLSRAFGDHSYKKNTDLPLRDQMITALPDVKMETLQPNDEFLVVACDGIWNSLSSQQVVDFIRERIKQGKSCVDISEELCDHCLAPSTAGDGTGCDNMTVIIATITH
ncbi:protein phosphatase 2C [Necator americanus]|uniref:protein-serine/threonine phosphatase n=1 Tax=Necator americanus TaxID=51031 RepID=W2SRH0_NECAM|nr:protein phosphatase 2C [Necator americanus]ETN72319.1 protein phosphatase 2C [Necator americanus]